MHLPAFLSFAQSNQIVDDPNIRHAPCLRGIRRHLKRIYGDQYGNLAMSTVQG